MLFFLYFFCFAFFYVFNVILFNAIWTFVFKAAEEEKAKEVKEAKEAKEAKEKEAKEAEEASNEDPKNSPLCGLRCR